MQEAILLAGSTQKSICLLQSLLPSDTAETTRICMTGSEVRRAMAEQDFSAVFINTPLPDESGLDLAMDIAHGSTAAVLLLVKADLAEAVSVRMEQHGVLVIAKPVVRQLFEQSYRCAIAVRNRLVKLQNDVDKLQKKLNEVRTVDRAKCLLIQYDHMTEDQAHRIIEKTAMDTRKTKLTVAREIIERYED